MLVPGSRVFFRIRVADGTLSTVKSCNFKVSVDLCTTVISDKTSQIHPVGFLPEDFSFFSVSQV